jgi:hypothetical protein
VRPLLARNPVSALRLLLPAPRQRVRPRP